MIFYSNFEEEDNIARTEMDSCTRNKEKENVSLKPFLQIGKNSSYLCTY